MFNLKIPLLNDAFASLGRWASEIRSYSFYEGADFLFNNFDSSVVGGGALTITAGTYMQSKCKFFKIPFTKICFVSFSIVFTLGGVAANTVVLQLPLASDPLANQAIALAINNGAGIVSGIGDIAAGSKSITVGKFDASNFALAVTRVYGNFFYEVATV